MEGIGALYVTNSKEGSIVAPSSIWAEKPFMANVKLPLSHEKPSSALSAGPGVVELPDTEPCSMSIVPVTVQFLHSKLTPGLLKPSISTQLQTVLRDAYGIGALRVTLSTPGKAGGSSGVSI